MLSDEDILHYQRMVVALKETIRLMAEIDKAVGKLWGITDDELKAIQDALAETGKSKRAAKEENDP